MFKRFLFTMALLILSVLAIEPARELLGNFVRLDSPKEYQIKTGDWLSKIAKENYGDVSYWQELALINRAPKASLIFPGEEIIVPSFDAIHEIRKARKLSLVNQLVGYQEDILAGGAPPQQKQVTSTRQPKQQTKSESARKPGITAVGPQEQQPSQTQATPELAKSERQEAGADPENKLSGRDVNEGRNGHSSKSWVSSTPVITAFVILGVVVLVGAFLYVQNKRREEHTYRSAKSDRTRADEPKKDVSSKRPVDSSFNLPGAADQEVSKKSSNRNRRASELL